jgi:hypothetical protein
MYRSIRAGAGIRLATAAGVSPWLARAAKNSLGEPSAELYPTLISAASSKRAFA